MAMEIWLSVFVSLIAGFALAIVFSRIFYSMTRKSWLTLLLSFVFIIIAGPISIAAGFSIYNAFAPIPCTTFLNCFGEAFFVMFLMGLFGVVAYIVTILVMYLRKLKREL